MTRAVERDQARVKILVIATQKTAVAARISMALVDAGFRVAAATPHGHPVRCTRTVQHHFSYRNLTCLHSITRAVRRWSPDLLVCTDDLAVRQLQKLYVRSAASKDKDTARMSELIELSLGPADSFSAMRDKSEFLSRVCFEGLRGPRTTVLSAGQRLKCLPADLNYPVVVKADRSYGGICVRVANNAAEVRNAVWELQTPTMWRGILRRFIGAVLASDAFGALMLPLRRTVSLQQFIAGRAANRAVVCWKGKVLAGLSVEVVEVKHESGPASVVQVIDHAEMSAFAEQMVSRLGLSGFIGFDFILDSSNEAWMIEMNPRVTPICHLSLVDGTNLAASLYRHFNGSPPRSALIPINSRLIALFPNEIVRCPSSGYLQSGHHDVPWNEPELVCSVFSEALRSATSRGVRTLLERHLPGVTQWLNKRGLVHPSRDTC